MRILSFFAKAFMSMRMFLFSLMILGAVAFIVASVVTYLVDRPNIGRIEASATPTAKYRVDTSTRYYFTNDYTRAADKSYTLQGYWGLERNKWVYSKDNLPLKGFGEIKITNLEAVATSTKTTAPTSPAKTSSTPKVTQLPVPVPTTTTPGRTAAPVTRTPAVTPSQTTTPSPSPTKKYPWMK